MDKRLHVVEWGSGKPRKRTSVANRELPLTWNREPFYRCTCGWRGAAKDSALHSCGGTISVTRRRVFSASLSDWLDNEVPIEWFLDLLDTIRLTPNLDWLLLSKRIGNWRRRVADARERAHQERRVDLGDWLSRWLDGHAPSNVWVGETISDQPEADRDIPKLQRVPAVVRFLSIEPMLAAIDLRKHIGGSDGDKHDPRCVRCGLSAHGDDACPPGFGPRPDWIIVGGESGHSARPMMPDWVRALRDQCSAADVAFFFKQWGEWLPVFNGTHEHYVYSQATKNKCEVDGQPFLRVGKDDAGCTLDGRVWSEFPSPPRA